jgi:hypothetical protein
MMRLVEINVAYLILTNINYVVEIKEYSFNEHLFSNILCRKQLRIYQNKGKLTSSLI